jgi:hypothetical protein
MKSPVTLVDPIVTVIVIPTGGTTPWCTEPLLGRTEDSSDFRMRFSLPYTTAMDTGHPHTISLKLRDMNQLFNSMDPSPFIEKDLDDDAEEFIVSWAQEFSPNSLWCKSGYVKHKDGVMHRDRS